MAYLVRYREPITRSAFGKPGVTCDLRSGGFDEDHDP